MLHDLSFVLWLIMSFVGMSLVALSIVGFLGGLWWVFDLCAHFRVQYLISLLAVLLFLIVLRSVSTPLAEKKGSERFVYTILRFHTWCLVGIIAAVVVNVILIAPLYTGRKDVIASECSRKFRILMANVHTANARYGKVCNLIDMYEPDFLLLEETDQKWLDALCHATEPYPYSIARPRGDNFGIAFFSKLPLERSRIVRIGTPDIPSVLIRFESGQEQFTIVGTHTIPPLNGYLSGLRDDHLSKIPDVVKDIEGALLLVGDLNVTPWSYHFRRLLSKTALKDSSHGWGYQPTWHAHVPLMRIPIDHCLHSSDILIKNRQVGTDIGSDHLPLLVDFVVLR